MKEGCKRYAYKMEALSIFFLFLVIVGSACKGQVQYGNIVTE